MQEINQKQLLKLLFSHLESKSKWVVCVCRDKMIQLPWVDIRILWLYVSK